MLSFIRHNKKNNLRVDILLDSEWVEVPGFWPLVDENGQATKFIAVGNKNGIPLDMFFKVKHEYGNVLKFVYTCMNAPYMIKNYDFINKEFDGIFDLDYKPDNPKRLNCSHSMIVRSLPYEGNFWEYKGEEKIYDFSMLTWSTPGDKCKRWDRGQKICEYLCGQGLKGLVVNQRGKAEDLLTDKLLPLYNSGLLTLKAAEFDDKEFHSLMSQSRWSIFPNNTDAFPKIVIEELLSDKPIVISNDLFQGKQILSELSCVKVIDFHRRDFCSEIAGWVTQLYKGVSPRDAWLEKYNFRSVTRLWAKEFNAIFGTSFKTLHFMNHQERAKNIV